MQERAHQEHIRLRRIFVNPARRTPKARWRDRHALVCGFRFGVGVSVRHAASRSVPDWSADHFWFGSNFGSG